MIDVLIDEPGHLHRIDTVWLFISEDKTGEGVCAATMPNGMTMPLIAADEARLASLIPLAQKIATMSGKRVRLIKLSVREELDFYDP